MNSIKVFGIDLAKSVFQVCVWMSDGTIASNRKNPRNKLLVTLRQFPANTLIVMEACATSHYWGRTFQSIGLLDHLIPTQHVKAFIRHQKNGANDAPAICKAALRPGIHFVTIKTVGQQDIKTPRSARQLMVEQRAAEANQARALGAELGIELSVGIHTLSQRSHELIEDPALDISPISRGLLFSLLENLHLLDECIRSMEHNILVLCQQLPKYKVLITIPRIELLIAAEFLNEFNAEHFTNGRQLSSRYRLVPKQCSSGGKNNLSSMTKNGNRDLRMLIIHGARSVMLWSQKHDDSIITSIYSKLFKLQESDK
ncbi:IS110 family transposase [Salmonella enterica]|nr:IS110 family transposase [Salmonella enterica]